MLASFCALLSAGLPPSREHAPNHPRPLTQPKPGPAAPTLGQESAQQWEEERAGLAHEREALAAQLSQMTSRRAPLLRLRLRLPPISLLEGVRWGSAHGLWCAGLGSANGIKG